MSADRDGRIPVRRRRRRNVTGGADGLACAPGAFGPRPAGLRASPGVIHRAPCPNHWRNFGTGSATEHLCECDEMTLRERVEILLERCSGDDLDTAEVRLESTGLFPELAADWLAYGGSSPKKEPFGRRALVPGTPSERELDTLRCLAKGLNQAGGAAALGIGQGAFAARLKSARRKLGAGSLIEAVVIAVRAGFLE